MAHRTRPYLFYGAARALCGTCLRVVDAKELIEDDRVWLWKRCPVHGEERVLLADDAAYFRLGREAFLKAPEQVERYNTRFEHGCPYDCGICPDHEQHGCLTLLEVTDHCNLRCPTCYASSGPERTTHRSLEQIERMLDRIVANEREPDVVQLSGGEPTLHPDFFAVLDACRRRPIRHLMLNTNGVRIAREDGFAERLAAYAPRFELYLQFDSLREGPLRTLRGADLRAVRERALDKLDALNLSTTLVVLFELPADLLHWTAAPEPFAHAGATPLFGRTVLGGVLGGWAAVELAKWRLGYRGATGDRFALPLAIALTFGRIGCTLTGCCPGVPVARGSAWARLSVVHHDPPRFPATLLEAYFHAAAAVLLLLASRGGVLRGRRLAAYLTAYAVARFALEEVRANPPVALGLSYYQWLAVALLVLAGGTWVRRSVAARAA